MTSSEKTAPTAEYSSEWPTDSSSYQLLGKIGQGAFATVYKALARSKEDETNELSFACAVKILNLDHVDTNLQEIRREVQALRLSSHPNVLPCYTAFVSDIHLWLVTPLMNKGSSLHCLQQARKLPRQGTQVPKMEDFILYILHETLLGLQYIHDNGQIHRDIKAGNILLDGNGDVRIADFGVSGWLVQGGQQQQKAQTFVGTPCWMAPEVMEQIHGYDYKADIWSLGITAMELAKGYAPYAKYPPMKVLILTIQEDPPSLDTYEVEDDDDDVSTPVAQEDYSKAFRYFVETCLQKNPSRRPTCQELLQNHKSLSVMNDPASRQARKEAMQEQVCAIVPNVGDEASSGTESPKPTMPGNVPVSILVSQRTADRPAGTTWVFADGSQILS